MRDASVSWQKILAEGFTSSSELLGFLGLPPFLASADAEKKFKTRVPLGFAKRMQPNNEKDPLLLQVLAMDAENLPVKGYVTDPLNETLSNQQKGLIHKYHGRVLLTLTGVCAVNCRYCFRRHFPYQDNNPGSKGWQGVLDYIRDDSSINEVIFSGGDPLLANNALLASLMSELVLIPHLKTLRFHSRIPVVLPERIDDALLSLLAAMPLRKVIVLHVNHAQELDEQVKQVCAALRQAGCLLLCQSVLLKGINDCVETLIDLSEKLFEWGILPYYLHVLDKVAGAAHFDLSTETAIRLHQELQARLPGYLVPRLAREEAGKKNKTLLF